LGIAIPGLNYISFEFILLNVLYSSIFCLYYNLNSMAPMSTSTVFIFLTLTSVLSSTVLAEDAAGSYLVFITVYLLAIHYPQFASEVCLTVVVYFARLYSKESLGQWRQHHPDLQKSRRKCNMLLISVSSLLF